MAELTNLEEKLAEVLGLAQAAQKTTKKVAGLVEDESVKSTLDTYLGDDADGLDGLEFMTMAEAGELGHVAIVGKLNERAGEEELKQFVDWALPVQQRHFERTQEATLTLAAQEDPNSTE